jgi:MFS family permease
VISLRIKEPASAAARTRVPLREILSYASRPGPAAGYAAIFTLYFLLGAFTALVPLHLRDELGYGTLEVGLSFTVFATLSLLLHYPAGILADRRGPATPALIGIAATASAMAIIPIVRDVPSLIAVMALFGVGHGFVFPSASTLVTRESSPGERGIVTGLFYSLLVAGVAIGAPTMAVIAARMSSYAFGIWASSWFAFFGIPFVVRALRRPSKEVSPNPEPLPAAEPDVGGP